MKQTIQELVLLIMNFLCLHQSSAIKTASIPSILFRIIASSSAPCLFTPLSWKHISCWSSRFEFVSMSSISSVCTAPSSANTPDHNLTFSFSSFFNYEHGRKIYKAKRDLTGKKFKEKYQNNAMRGFEKKIQYQIKLSFPQPMVLFSNFRFNLPFSGHC